jgi:glycerol-3-phosphate dehydrogenase (NAD(P)+)
MDKNKILIVGKGELGTALNKVLSKNENNEVTLWGEEPDLPKAEIIFMAVPTFAVEDVVNKCNKTQNKDTILVVLSKGLKGSKTPLEIAQNNWLGKLSLVSGPMIAEELSQDKVGYGLVGSESEQVIERLISLFNDTNLELSPTDDLVGLSWLGPLKNVYALGLGFVTGQGKGMNYKGAYVTQAVKEMAEIINGFGGQRQTAYSLAGLGDLIATGFSPNSSNFEYGRSLAQNEKRGEDPEGISVFKGLKQRINKDYPLLTELLQLIDNQLA